MPQNQSYPIRTREMAEKVSNSLSSQYMPYSILFDLLTGTGAPLSHILPLSVGEISASQQLTFRLRKDSDRLVTSLIPYELQNKIGDYYGGKAFTSPDEPAFLSISGDRLITADEFWRRLERTSIDCNFPAPGLNAACLRKTFLYRMLLEDGSPDRALEFLGWTSAKKLYRHLGLTKLVPKEGSDAIVTVYDDDIINTVIGETLMLLEEVKYHISIKETFDKYDAPAIIALCADLRRAVSTYYKDSKPWN